jgi:hypothetical protein
MALATALRQLPVCQIRASSMLIFFFALVASSPPDGSISLHARAAPGHCTSAHDCNAPACLDCACQNGRCVCTEGWSGPNCVTPFCTNRTAGCSGHGDCSATISNISCTCDLGWVGPRCAAKVCNITCTHGGVPDKACTRCEGCLGAWSGLHCETWNASSVPAGALAARIAALQNKSRAKLEADLQYNPICKPGQECTGWGVDATSGKVADFPMLSLDFTGEQPEWHGFKFAKGTLVKGIDSPDYSLDTKAFQHFDQYMDYVTGLWASGQARGGGYASSLDAIYDDIFQSSADASLGTTVATYELYEMSLIPDASEPSRYHLEMDTFALEALQGLGPWAQDKANWRQFFGAWGTSVVTSSRSGGIEQLNLYPSTALNNFSGPWLEAQARCKATHEMQKGAVCDPDPFCSKYISGKDARCFGGDASVCPITTSPTKEQYSAWQSSLYKVRDAPSGHV